MSLMLVVKRMIHRVIISILTNNYHGHALKTVLNKTTASMQASEYSLSAHHNAA